MKPSFASAPLPPHPRLRIESVQVLSQDWYLLRKITFDWLRRDGKWQRQSREAYDRGNGATLLLFNATRGTVVLTRIAREAEEETGFRIRSPRKVFEAYMSPGSVTEKLHFYVAEYQSADRIAGGGGDVSEGEDIEVIELTLDEALRRVSTGAVEDAKTIMLLQHAALTGLDRLAAG
jgi:hypothetical protein